MTIKEEQKLLFIDLLARVPYGVIACMATKLKYRENCIIKSIKILQNNTKGIEIEANGYADIHQILPYLRPLYSLTQEERDKFCDIGGVISHKPDGKLYIVAYSPEALDYLNSIHADYRGLIEKGLAIKVTKENNPYK